MYLSAHMIHVLSQLQVGRTTRYGYTDGTNRACGGASRLNARTVQALINQGLLERAEEIPFSGHGTHYYCISKKGQDILTKYKS